jgi:hypothetical protein
MVSGGKNAAVAIIPAALLGDSPSVIENVPDINDVHIIIEMLRYLGAQVEFKDNVMTIDPRTADKFDPPYELASRMRASYYFAPVLLGVFRRCSVPLPGGCDIGPRPIDQTLKGMRTPGAEVDTPGGVIMASADELVGEWKLTGQLVGGLFITGETDKLLEYTNEGFASASFKDDGTCTLLGYDVTYSVGENGATIDTKGGSIPVKTMEGDLIIDLAPISDDASGTEAYLRYSKE